MAGFLDQFGGLKLGQSKTIGGFTGTQELPDVTVIRGVPSASSDIDNWLMRGYALKDAVAATAGSTAADATKVNTTLAPAESAARNALNTAQANVQNVSARLAPAESAARIGESNAQAGYLGIQGQVLKKRGLSTTTIRPEDYSAVTAPVQGAINQSMVPWFRFSQ